MTTPETPEKIANASAWFGVRAPRTRTRFRVRIILESYGISVHWLKAFADAAHAAVPAVVHKSVLASRTPGATAYPAMAVRTTRDVKRDLDSSAKRPGYCASVGGAVTLRMGGRSASLSSAVLQSATGADASVAVAAEQCALAGLVEKTTRRNKSTSRPRRDDCLHVGDSARDHARPSSMTGDGKSMMSE